MLEQLRLNDLVFLNTRCRYNCDKIRDETRNNHDFTCFLDLKFNELITKKEKSYLPHNVSYMGHP